MRDQIFFTSIFAFLIGVLVRSIWIVPEFVLVFLSVCSLIFIPVYFIKKKNILLLIFFAVIFFVLGVFRFDFVDRKQPKNVFDDLVGQEVNFEGIILEETDRRENSQRLIVGFEDVRVLVSTDLYPEFFYGDKVLVSGELSKPKNFTTDVGKEFNYVDYLAKDGIYYSVSFADVSFLESGHGSKIKTILLTNKRKFLDKIEEIIPDPGSSLLGGLLLGTKQSLGENLQQDFINTGLIHIVVLSGYNVTIIAEAILRTLAFMPQVFSVSLGAVSIVFFAVMTGAGATIVRASIMAILALIARSTGNSYNITRALVFSGALMVLHNPYILYFDISFQLSFMATIGLIYLSPVFKQYFKWLPSKWGLQDIASATIATQVFVLPFILFKMGTLSLIAPITNMIVLPFIPATMLFGFMTGILSFVSEILATPFAFVSHVLLSFEIKVVEVFGGLSFSVIEMQNFSVIFVIVIYIFIFWIIYKNYKIITDEQNKLQ